MHCWHSLICHNALWHSSWCSQCIDLPTGLMHCCTFSTVHNALLHLGAVVTMHSYVHNALCHIFDCPKCISNHYESTWQCPHLHFSKLWPRPVQKGGGGSTPPPFWSTRLQPRYRVKHGPGLLQSTTLGQTESQTQKRISHQLTQDILSFTVS